MVASVAFSSRTSRCVTRFVKPFSINAISASSLKGLIQHQVRHRVVPLIRGVQPDFHEGDGAQGRLAGSVHAVQCITVWVGVWRLQVPPLTVGRCRVTNPTRSEADTRDMWTALDREQAAALCVGCPIRTPCSEAADQVSERHHVWGGQDRTQ